MCTIFIFYTPMTLSELAEFVFDDAGRMMFIEMIEEMIDGATLPLPFILSDEAQPRILLLFDLFFLINIREHHEFLLHDGDG